MKRFILFIFFLNFFFSAKSQELAEDRFFGFKWTIDGIHVLRIDTKKFTLTSEDLNGKITNVGELKTSPDIFKDLPPLFNAFPFFSTHKIIFTVEGTGQVYQLDTKTMVFSREDITYFRGFNFSAHQFFRNDILFSIGGSGFWMNQSLITYFNKTTKEWDLLEIKNEGPVFVDHIFSGYEKEKDVFFAVDHHADDDVQNKNISVFEFHFQDQIWIKKGDLQTSVVDILKNKYKYLWTGKYAVFYGFYQTLIIDPTENKAFKIESKNKLTDSYFSLVSIPSKSIGKKIYSRSLNLETTGLKFTVDSFTVEDLLKQSVFIGDAYKTQANYSLTLIEALAGASGFVILILIINNLITKNKNLVRFTSEEKLILGAFYKLEEGQFLSVFAVNSCLDINDKTYDNQRKIRNNAISKLNDKLYKKFNFKDAIQKMASADDKRVSNYFMNQKVKSKIPSKYSYTS